MDDLLPARFRTLRLLGRGGAADVYEAYDTALDRAVAVKLFRADGDDTTHRRFVTEATTLAGLIHPGLVTVYSAGVHADRPYLVMRLIEGETLQSLLLNGPLAPEFVARLGARLATALAHVHRNRIVHRDVKPSNVLLDDDGTPFLGDFGIALAAGRTRLTRTNEIIGTPAYLAPEQVLGAHVGPAADIYALGLVLLECLTGEVEFQAGSEVETAVARLHRPPRVPRRLPDGLSVLLLAMTDRDPARRPSADRCARQLLAEATALSETPTVVASPVGRRRLVRSGAAVAVALAALTVAFALSWNGPTASGRPLVAPAAEDPSSDVVAVRTTSPTPAASTVVKTSAPVVVVATHTVAPPAHHGRAAGPPPHQLPFPMPMPFPHKGPGAPGHHRH